MLYGVVEEHLESFYQALGEQGTSLAAFVHAEFERSLRCGRLEHGFARVPETEDGRQSPLRAPHHTASVVGMLGGGTPPRSGEVTLADGGVLFLDELPEFSGSVREALREPLETGSITLMRANERTTCPARFQLVAAMSPCPCGACDEPEGVRRCSPEQVARYRARVARTISGSLHEPA